ncbi:hypothetical protein [Sphingomonas oryzagri]
MRHAGRERHDDAPEGDCDPPHIRKALRDEWEREAREKAARQREEGGGSAVNGFTTSWRRCTSAAGRRPAFG